MTTGETWAAAQLKPTAPGPPPLPQPSGLPWWGTGRKAGLQPTPKAARAPPPTPIPGRCHVSSPARSLQAPSLTATRGSRAARNPAEAMGAGQRRGAFVSEKQRWLGQLGEGPGPSPVAPSRAWEALGRRRHCRRGTMGTGGSGRGPATQRRPSPAPGVSSFLQVVLLGPLTPSKKAQARLAPWGSWMGPGTPSSTLCGLAFSWAPQ